MSSRTYINGNLHTLSDDGYLHIHEDKTIRIYGPGPKRAFLGLVVKRGMFESTPRHNCYGHVIAGVKTSDHVFDIIGPRGGMLVRGCITNTLWAHVDRELKGKAHAV